MTGKFKDYITTFSKISKSIIATQGKDKKFPAQEVINNIAKVITRHTLSGGKILFIGNGGSASISSHIATDLLKNVGMPALAFNDASLLTCLSNDLGYERVFSEPLKMLAGKNDILFAISSSGRSQNILNACKAAKKKGCFLITLSGFDPKNPLRAMGDINIYVPSDSYGYVEITHLAICHFIVDKLMEKHKQDG